MHSPSDPDRPARDPAGNPAKDPSAAPVAIIGMGCMFPKARDLAGFWANIREGVDGISETPPTHWRPEDYFDADPGAPDMTYGRRGGFLDPTDFDPLEFGISPRDVEAIDTSQLLGLAVAKRALQDAGYPAESPELQRDRVSVVLGVTGTLEMVIPLGARLGHPIWRRALRDAGVDDATSDDVVERIKDGYVGWQENSFPGLLGNVVAGRIANRLDLHGTNCVVDAACASSLSAVHLALLELETGRADLVVTGGVDTFNDIFMYMCFSKTPALSPTGDARPFAAAGDGTILGEGLGMLVLKRLADAERDGDRIYAVIRGIGASSDGKGNAVYAPSAEGQARALRTAYRNARVDPSTIELVEGHGTGTKVGDATEIRGLSEVYGPAGAQGSWCALGSVKSMIGHTKAAAGAAGLIKAALALHHRVLPPTLKVDRPNEAAGEDSPFYVNTEKRPWLPRGDHPRRAAVSAFGFGGSNFHCVLEEYAPDGAAIDWDGQVQVLPLSAADRTQLGHALDERAAQLVDRPWAEVRAAAAECRRAFDPGKRCRLVVVLERGRTAASDLLQAARNLLDRHGDAPRFGTPQGIYFASGPAGRVAALFPGQGSQYPGMLRDLACRFAAAQAVLAAADAQGDAARLSDLVYPHPAFEDGARRAQAEALRRTDVAQPAIGAVSLAALEVLRHFGVRFDAAAGHSYGELTALCAAERIDPETFHRLSRERGRLMATGGEDRGAMLAVLCPAEDLDTWLSGQDLDLVVANRNAPAQSVLSGATAEIERAAGMLDAAGLRSRRLEVAAAFHSPLVAGAAAPFAAALRDVAFGPGTIPVYANTTGQEYPTDPVEARQLLGGQLAAPVEFVATIRNMRQAGVTTFVEVGPGKVLSGLAGAILDGDTACQTVAVDAGGGGAADLARTLAQLAAAGHRVDLTRWDPDFLAVSNAQSAARKPAFTVPLSGANYRAPHTPKPPATRAAPAPAAAQKTAGPPAVTPPPADRELLAQALRANQESLQALAQMQQQTAELHRRFLEAQEQATRSFEQLIARQQSAFGGAAPLPSALPAPVVAAPRPEFPPAPVVIAAPPPAPAAPVAAAAPAPAPAGDSAVAGVLLAVVADKTGYPAEMLELSMGLDADLGIDSIKRVEILSALQERLPHAPVVRPEHLGELQTLGQIVAFLGGAATPAAAPATTPATTTGATATATPASGHADVAAALLSIVADKTGYPAEMLELSMGLDADLGIDSIKRVEILSALQEALPHAPVVKPEHLGELQTLAHIVDFLAAGSAAPPAPAPAPVDDRADLTAVLLEIVADKTGYPAEMLELSMGLDADLGIDSIKRVEILSALQERLPHAPVVKPEHLGELQTLAHIADFLAAPATTAQTARPAPVRAAPEPAPAPAITRHVPARRQVKTPLEVASSLPAEAVVWVTRTDDGLSAAIVARLRHLGVKASEVERTTTATPPEELAGLIVVAPLVAAPRFLHESFALTRRAGTVLRATGERSEARYATVARLDGAFGFGELDTAPPHLYSGGLAGLAKTVGHEWPQVHAIALDVDAAIDDAAWAAERVVAQFLSDGAGEFGIGRKGTCTLELVEEEVAAAGPVFGAQDVVVITGGARGVTAEVAIALAHAGAPRLVLLGRSGEPTPEPHWLRDLEDETSIKQAILDEARRDDKSSKLSPRALGDAYRAAMSNREILRNIARMENAGSRVVYRSVDVRDGDALAACIAEVADRLGPITGLIHGAGVLADSYITDKTDAEFERVFATKIEGLERLLEILEGHELRALVTFSSSTARFGRTGQADYAVANEVLNKIAQHQQRLRPECRVVSVNWGPWDGGMVTPALREIFAGEGISVIDLAAGASYMLAELANTGGPVEVVVLGHGSALPAREDQQADLIPALSALPELPTVFERTLDLADHAFLEAHVLDGKAVLPVAAIVEWLGHGALHGNPGLRFAGATDLQVFKGVILGAGESLDLRVCADKATRHDGRFHVVTELCSTDASGHRALHARATVVLAGALDASPEPAPAQVLPPYETPLRTAYAEFLFHGPLLQGLDAVTGCAADGIVATCHAADAPRAWSARPLRSRWIADPLALDCAFQLMILWSFAQRGEGCLPTGFKSYRQFASRFPDEGIRIEARVTGSEIGKASADIDWLDSGGRVLARMTGYQCVVDASLRQAFRRNTLDTRSTARR